MGLNALLITSMFIIEELFSVPGQQKRDNSTWYPNTLVVIKV